MIYEMYVYKHTCVQDIVDALLDDRIMKQTEYNIKIYIPNETQPVDVYCKPKKRYRNRYLCCINFKKFHFNAEWYTDIKDISELIYVLAFPEFMTTFLLSRYARGPLLSPPHVYAFANMIAMSDAHDERCISYLHQCFRNYNEYLWKHLLAYNILNRYENIMLPHVSYEHRNVYYAIKNAYMDIYYQRDLQDDAGHIVGVNKVKFRSMLLD